MTASTSRWMAAALFASVSLAALLFAQAARAGAVYFDLVIDPATTAGAGVAPIPGPGGGPNLVVPSSRSGSGTWHLYAIDDIDGSFGIRGFNVKLNPGAGGTIPAITNRSPVTTWLDIDGNDFGAGFDDLRSSLNPITGYQGAVTPNVPPIGGFGISTGNFKQKITDADAIFATSGQWGIYADSFAFGFAHGHAPVFLAEGTYTGSAPTVDLTTPAASGGTAVDYWTNAALTTSASAAQLANYVGCSCGITIFDGNINNVDPNNPGFINYKFTVIQDLPSTPNFVPMTWDFLSQGYPTQPATIDSSGFHWNTMNVPPGTYNWAVRASAEGYSGIGYLRVTLIPEPTALTLAASVLIGIICIGRRRDV